MSSIFGEHLAAHVDLFGRLGGLAPAIDAASARLADALRAGGKLMFCGNGGSAADSQHLASEFVGRFVNDRRPLAALALTTDTSALTSIANDYAFEHVFERQVLALGRPGDVLVGLSTSGHSPNVRRAVDAARSGGITTLGLLGRDGGAIGPLCDLALVVPSDVTARIQEVHIFIGHVLCAAVEARLGV